MLVIRLRRIGRKKDPHYRLVVAEHTSPVQGKFIAEIGHYHPKSKECVIKKDLFNDWVAKGAQPSNTVARLANKQNITESDLTVETKNKQPKAKAKQLVADKAAKVEAAKAKPVEETPAAEADAPAAEEAETATEETVSEEPTVIPADETAPEVTEAPAEEATTDEATA